MDSNHGFFGGSYNSYQNNGMEKKDFNKIASSIGSNIQKISQNVLSMKRMVNHLGTAQDTQDLRQKLHQIQHYTNNLAKDTSSSLKELSSIPLPLTSSEQRECKMQKERLTEEFTLTLSAFQEAQRLACSKEKEEAMKNRANVTIPPPPSSHDPFDNTLLELQDTSQMKQKQSLASLQQEEQNLQLFAQQEEAILQLERDINDVNMIFKELGSLVHQQGEMVDSIEAYVESTEVSVGMGTTHLRQASQHANKARKKMCFLYTFLAVVLASVILLIVWQSH